MSGWHEVFRAGKYPQGDVTVSQVQEMVDNYDPDYIEAPVVIGHPKNNDPAYGWVSGLKRRGDVLFAQFRELVPEFVQAVQDGRFKKRSIRMKTTDRGKYLVHVGFLGAALPAVPGLAPVQFSEEQGLDYELDATEDTMADVSKQEVQEQINAALKTQRDEMMAQFEEKYSSLKADFSQQLTDKEQDYARQIGAERAARERAEIEADLDRREQAGKLAPALRKAGLADFMASLDSGDKTLDFAAEDGDRKVSQREFMNGLLDALPKVVEFSELAGRNTDPGKPSRSSDGIDTDGAVVDEASSDLDRRVQEYMSNHIGVSYEDALSTVERG